MLCVYMSLHFSCFRECFFVTNKLVLYILSNEIDNIAIQATGTPMHCKMFILNGFLQTCIIY